MSKLRPILATFSIFTLGCGHASSSTPTAAPLASSPMNGQFLVDSLPSISGCAVLQIQGTSAVIRPAIGGSERTVRLVGNYPAFRLEAAGAVEKPSAQLRLLFTTPDTGWIWRSQEDPSRIDRIIALPEAARGEWAALNPVEPVAILGQANLQPDAISLAPPADRHAVSYFVTTEGGIGFRELSGNRESRFSGQLFLAEGFAVLEIERNAILLHRPGQAPGWLPAVAAKGSTQPPRPRTFFPFSNGFLDQDLIRVGGKDVGPGKDANNGVLDLPVPTQAGPMMRFALDTKRPSPALLVDKQRAWLWILPSKEPGTPALAEAVAPTGAMGEWTATAVNAKWGSLARVQFMSQGATFFRNDGKKSTWRWAERGFLFSQDDHEVYQVFPTGTGWLMEGSDGDLTVLHQGLPPSWAQSRQKMIEQLGKLCQAAQRVSAGKQEKRVEDAIAIVSAQEDLLELLEKTVRDAAHGFGRGGFMSFLPHIGVPFPADCFRAP